MRWNSIVRGDIGGSAFDHAAHEPVDSAKVSWDIEDDGELTASYDGFMHLEPRFGQRVARVQIRALNNAGKVLARASGDAHYEQTPVYEFDEDKLSVTTADAIRLTVQIQTQDPITGNWTDVPGDSQTVSVAE